VAARSPDPVPDDALVGAGPALFRLVRSWSRRWIGAATAATGGTFDDEPHVVHLLVLEAIGRAATEGPVSIGDVAGELGIDRSGASRMVADAVEGGYVAKSAAPTDGRRAVLTVTDRGTDLLAAAHAWQQQVFADLVAGWSRRDATRFAGYVHRLADEAGATTPPERGAR
jgi:DNA-binding MarR family transcriptional regulator